MSTLIQQAAPTQTRGTLRRVAVLGASGYTGAELLRLVVQHPNLELVAASSDSSPDTRLDRLHPHLRGAAPEVRGMRTMPHAQALAADVDVALLAVPHGKAMPIVPQLLERGIRPVDLSADFRLRDPAAYPVWYDAPHTAPALLREAVYGIAELHRDAMPQARILAGAGCIATAAILALHPLARSGLIRPEHIVVDAKIGSSAAGATANAASHHADRQRAVRPYAIAGHRHTAEIAQEIRGPGFAPQVALSAHAIELVRGVFVTCHAWLADDAAGLDEKELWKTYRAAYGDEPFVRTVKERQGVHRDPDPRLLAGTNVAEVGFALDPGAPRVVATAALDNLTKGAAGAAIQNLNVAMGWPETLGLPTIGLYPFA